MSTYLLEGDGRGLFGADWCLYSCLCGHHFCILCASAWPAVSLEHPDREPPPLCHPFFGHEDKHVLRIPDAVQAQLDAEEEKPPPAVR